MNASTKSIFAVVFLFTGFFGSVAGRPAPARPPVPVLVELFTSEGCSSCPPADAVLKRLSEDQPVAGAQIIALEFHVDYWNGLGWPDRFSAPEFTARQRDYVRAMNLRGGYTPQRVVNGRGVFVGSDASAAREAIAGAARAPLPVIKIERLSPAAPGKRLLLRVTPPSQDGEILHAALSETGLESAVGRGENAGRQLRHAAVVRTLAQQAVRGGAPVEFTLSVPAGANPSHLAIVVWMQKVSGGPVTALAIQPAQ